jgi:pimeloyl-ACP methyl ester carboxylesterase
MTTQHNALSPHSHIVELPAGRFHYLAWGEEYAERPPAVLIHGITSSALSWTRVGPALADRYRVYALDMRGHGDSIIPPAGSYSLQATTGDVLAFVNELQLQRPLLIGHSWGGATALVLASGTNSVFSQVVLEDPACYMGRDDPMASGAHNTKDIGRPLEEVRQELLADNSGWTEEDVEGKLDALQKVSRDAVINIYNEVNQAGNLLPLLAQVTVPTLLLRADPKQDYSTLTEEEWLQARTMLPSHSRALQIEGASHSIHRSRFTAFMQAVNAFLQGEH